MAYATVEPHSITELLCLDKVIKWTPLPLTASSYYDLCEVDRSRSPQKIKVIPSTAIGLTQKLSGFFPSPLFLQRKYHSAKETAHY